MATAGEFGVGTRALGFRTVKKDKGAFNYNREVEVETSQVGYKDWFVRPIGGVSNKLGPFFFFTEAEMNYYLQLGATRLECVFSVHRADGSRLQNLHDVVAPNNLLGGVMWESVEPSINGQPLSGASCVNAGMKHFIETMLSCDQNARHTHMQLQLGHMDSPGEYDNMNLPMSVFRQQFRRLLELGQYPMPHIPPEAVTLPPGATKPDGTVYSELEREKENILRARRQKEIVDAYFYHEMGLDAERQQTLTLLQPELPTNLGFQTRCKIVANSEKVTMMSPIPHDIFNMDNNLGAMNRLDLKLTMYPHRFLLNSFMRRNGYEIKLHDLKLHLRAIRLRETIKPPIRELYRMNETNLFKHVVPAGLTNYSFRLQHTGVLPKSIILATAATVAVEGHYQKNPFNFHHYFCKKISLSINGEERPQNGLNFDFERTNQDLAYGYHWLFANTGALAGNRGNLVSLPHFSAGCFLVPFDLTPDRCNGAHTHNAELGYIDVNYTWAYPLPEPITILYEMTFNKVLLNDKAGGTLTVLDVAA